MAERLFFMYKTRMKLVTVATHSRGYFPWLCASCARMGVQLVVLGWHTPWQGYGMKLRAMHEYTSTLPPTELVCFIDAWDTLLLRPLADMERTYKTICAETGKSIVAGCEYNTSNAQALFTAFRFKSCGGQYLNSGTYIGPAALLADMFEEMKSADSDDDQALMTEYCRQNNDIIHVDCDNALFLTVCDTSSVSTEYMVRRMQQLQPCVLHGNCNTDLHDIITYLGYDITALQRAGIRVQAKWDSLAKSFYHGKLLYIVAFILVLFKISQCQPKP